MLKTNERKKYDKSKKNFNRTARSLKAHVYINKSVNLKALKTVWAGDNLGVWKKTESETNDIQKSTKKNWIK